MSPITLNDLIAVEEQGLKQDSMQSVRYLLFRSLLKRHPDLVVEQVGEMVTLENIGEINDFLVGALSSTDGETPKGKAIKRRKI